ncbi:hypothetical protein ACIQTZ_16830 [Paenarthrobacter sp. NPDC090520]|uniref:hypothetical protein n=1 Tax=Paenarthrobacter sp. NPDC090520 TaxID=3364382 RepID=UPI0038004C70
MTSKFGELKRKATDLGRAVAYSSTGREVARSLMESAPESAVRRLIKARGLEARVRKVAAEHLPQGIFFAKLTLPDWEDHQGEPFQLLQDGEVVYGNLIEPPARGFPLEYRNIMVGTDDPSRFRLASGGPFELGIGRGPFTTPQQIKYDEQYGVEQHGDAYYSVRGNTTDPKRMLLTFPGFGPSTTRISFAVSYLKGITDADLEDTLMVCFQDRYLAAGSYMMVDNAGRPLDGRINAAIEKLRGQFNIDPARMLFFGASKGASIAIRYARNFPAARLVLAVPQMNLPYYFSKPFFKDNLYRNRAFREAEQPEDLLRQYFAEGRTIDYFYTNSDELSNHSLIELVQDVPNLTKYRIDGKHSAVAGTALPAMLGIIREFLGAPAQETFVCEELRWFDTTETRQLQVRVDARASEISQANWFVGGWAGRTRFLQLMTDHSYKFVKYTSGEQAMFHRYDPVEHIDSLHAIASNGLSWTARLPEQSDEPENTTRRFRSRRRGEAFQAIPLDVEAHAPADYVILDGDCHARFRYRCSRASASGQSMEVHFVQDAAADVLNEFPRDPAQRPAFVAVVQPMDGWELAHLMALRLVVAADVPRLVVVVHGTGADEGLSALGAVEWDQVQVMAWSPKEAPAPAH